jgi:Rrf2 family iron-sulfur cluster assembly transcriptional regulator
MRISTKGRQALMTMLDLTHYADGTPIPLAAISERQNISLSYLEQLVARLKAAGLVKSTRGPGGGYTLGDKGDQIKVGEIVRAVEDDPTRLVIADPVTADVRMLTNYLWQAIEDQISGYLETVTLADVNNCTLCNSYENQGKDLDMEAISVK